MTARPRTLAGLWCVVYLLLIGLTLNNVRPYKGDESFYIASAMEMYKNGNSLIPEYFGEARFQKPILPYWLTLSGYHAFGISMWSGRLAFLFMAGLLLVVIYRFAFLLLPDEPYASLAVFLFTSSTLFLEFSRVAMADLPLTLFVTLGLFHFCKALMNPDKCGRNCTYAYLAMGFAFASKGFLGLLPLAAVILYLIIVRPREQRVLLTKLFHPLNLALFLLLALSWYVYAYISHPTDLLTQFRQESSLAITSHIMGCLGNLVSHAKDLLVYYVPFVAWAIYLAWRRRIKPPKHFALVFIYIAIALFILVILVQRHKARYLFVLFPALTLPISYVIYKSHLRVIAIRIAIVVALLQVSLYLAYPYVVGAPLQELTSYWRENLTGELTTHRLSERERGWVQAYTHGELREHSPQAPFIILRAADADALDGYDVIRRAKQMIKLDWREGELVREDRTYLLVHRHTPDE